MMHNVKWYQYIDLKWLYTSYTWHELQEMGLFWAGEKDCDPQPCCRISSQTYRGIR